MRHIHTEGLIVLFAFILSMLLCGSVDAGAATLKVPADYPTIQSGIDAAADGDTVLVDPGTYAENIILTKGVNVVSSAGPNVTTINSNSPAPVVSIMNLYGQPTQPVLQGFTIGRGNAGYGYGVEVEAASPTISGNIFDSKHDQSISFMSAIDLSGSSALIEKNIFRNNVCNNNNGVVPFTYVISVIDCDSPRILNNLIIDNASCPAISMQLPESRTPQVENNTIVGNGTGIQVDFHSSTHIYKNNIIVGNNVALDASLDNENVPWQNNLVFGNTTNYLGISDFTGSDGNISADPLFLDPSGGDYHLCEASPAIGAGNGDGIDPSATDLDGNPRVVDGHTDIGAYQFDRNVPEITFRADEPLWALPIFGQVYKLCGPRRCRVSVEFWRRDMEYGGQSCALLRPRRLHRRVDGFFALRHQKN